MNCISPIQMALVPSHPSICTKTVSTSSMGLCPLILRRRCCFSSPWAFSIKKASESVTTRLIPTGFPHRPAMIDPGGNMKLKTLCILIACSAALAMPALAHHSHGNYDTTTWTPFEGTVKELHYVTPHSFIYLEVKDEKGQPAIWLLEATNPRGLETKGIKREDVKPGDIVK